MEQRVYEMYLEELKEIVPLGQEEKEGLLAALAEGEQQAAERLIEGSLERVLRIAEGFTDKGVLLEDLVQEGNMALAMAVGEYAEGDFDEFTEDRIRQAMAALVEEQEAQEKTGEELVARVNVLQQVSKLMAEELGREATVEELAGKMKMTVDEIKDIMKMTLDAMSVDGK